MKFISVILVLGSLSYAVPAVCQTNPHHAEIKIGDGLGLTPKQVDLLGFAKEVAKEDGHNEPKYFLGILLQESKAGEIKEHRVSGLENKPGNRYFGVFQIKLKAALDVMKRWPEMWGFLDTKTEEELQARLILDDKFNVRIASKYALLMGINEHPNRAITAYNQGLGGVQKISDPKRFPYTVKVREYANKVEKYTLE